jgi:GDP-D-mannose 3', 5'-epimerase
VSLCVACRIASLLDAKGAKKQKKAKKFIFLLPFADWASNTYFKAEEFCSEFMLADLRKLDECLRVTAACDWVFQLAADMGGMGFIQSNAATLFYNNVMIDVNMVEAARKNNVKRFFYSSSACVYPESMQETTGDPGLREHTAWPAHPQDAYGLEKLMAEECCKFYGHDFPQTQFRIARFHNIYGPQGTWTGGREKAPAAFCRKAAASTVDFEVWGDGLQTRSFCYVDDCVDGILKLMESDVTEPLNIGSEEMVSASALALFSVFSSLLSSTLMTIECRGLHDHRGATKKLQFPEFDRFSAPLPL